MPTEQEVRENLNWTTGRVSDRVWTISVGVLATCLSFVIEDGSARDGGFLGPLEVALPACVALLALCCDLAQYIAADLQNRALLAQLEAGGGGSAKFDRHSLLRRVRFWAYNLKIVFCIVSACAIIAAIARAVLRSMDLAP